MHYIFTVFLAILILCVKKDVENVKGSELFPPYAGLGLGPSALGLTPAEIAAAGYGGLGYGGLRRPLPLY